MTDTKTGLSAEERAEIIIGRALGYGDVDSYPHLKRGIIEAITESGDERERQTREEDCKKMCKRCDEGYPTCRQGGSLRTWHYVFMAHER